MGVPISGRFGILNNLHHIGNWSITETARQAMYVASSTQFGAARKAGIRDWTGSYKGFGGEPAYMPGESFSFAGYVGPSDSVYGHDGTIYTGTAIVTDVAINWNWSSGEVLSHQVNFGGHLALTKSSGYYEDLEVPDIDNVCGTKIEYGDDTDTWPGGGGTEWENLVSAVLNITNSVQTYNNSSTVDGGVCWTGRRAGNYDWNLNVTVQDDDRTGLDIDDVVQLRCYINATDYWELFWGKVQEFSGLQVDRESGAILQHTVPLLMTGYEGGNVGQIILPSGGTFWPLVAAS